MSVAGLRGYLDACVPEAHVTVPDGVEKYEEKYFCSTCRELLEPYAQCGFVLADLRSPETPTIYPVEVGTEFEVALPPRGSPARISCRLFRPQAIPLLPLELKAYRLMLARP